MILNEAEFVAFVEECTGVPAAMADSIAASELDSMALFELITALDNCGIFMNEDLLESASTVRDVYEIYVVIAGHSANMSES